MVGFLRFRRLVDGTSRMRPTIWHYRKGGALYLVIAAAARTPVVVAGTRQHFDLGNEELPVGRRLLVTALAADYEGEHARLVVVEYEEEP